MPKQNETEYKFLISGEQFQEALIKCCKMFIFNKEWLQVNYYYDTSDNALNKNNTVIRIRQKHEDLQLQIKKRRSFCDGLSVCDEYTTRTQTLPYVMSITGFKEKVDFKGALMTDRKQFVFGRNSCICFDENMYLGFCDYEIEIEVVKEDMHEAQSLIKSLGLKQKTNMSKSERFFEKLEKMKNE